MTTVELSLHGDSAKRRVLETLRGQGYQAETGPVRLAYPFSVIVTADVNDIDDILLLARTIDPTAGQIITDMQRSTAVAIRSR